MKYSKLRGLIDNGELDLAKLSNIHSKLVNDLKVASLSPNKTYNPHQLSPKSDASKGGRQS